MFGLLDDVVNTTTGILGDVVETTTFGLVKSKDVKKLADKGWSIYQISQDLGITEDQVKELLND